MTNSRIWAISISLFEMLPNMEEVVGRVDRGMAKGDMVVVGNLSSAAATINTSGWMQRVPDVIGICSRRDRV